MEKTSGEKLREEGCFFLFWLKIHVKKNPFHSSFVEFFSLFFFSSPPPEAGVVRIRKVKKTEMFFRCCCFFLPECVFKNPQKPQVCFPAPAFVCRCFFFQHRRDGGSRTERSSRKQFKDTSASLKEKVFSPGEGCFKFYNISSGSGCFQIQ